MKEVFSRFEETFTIITIIIIKSAIGILRFFLLVTVFLYNPLNKFH